MFRRIKIFVIALLLASNLMIGQDTCSVNGVYINSLLVDPTGLLEDYDTNGDGRPNSNDEFIELCNSSQDTIDMGGWQIADDDPPPGADFVFPDSTMIAPGACLLLVANYCPVDSIPCEPPSGVIDMGLEFLGLLANGGDIVMLIDTTGFSCAVTYGDVNCENIDPLDAPDFNASDCEYWDVDVDGCPLLMLGDSCGYVPLSLPLSLLSFNIFPDDNGNVVLHWSVDPGFLSKAYMVEWTDNLNHQATELAYIESPENLDANGGYSYTHKDPVIGLNYYRLRVISGGSSYSTSEFRVINMTKEKKISVYPNPVADRLFIENSSKIEVLKIFKLSGELIDKIIPKTNFEFLDLNSLPEGIYVLQIFDGSQFNSIKFVKM